VNAAREKHGEQWKTSDEILDVANALTKPGDAGKKLKDRRRKNRPRRVRASRSTLNRAARSSRDSSSCARLNHHQSSATGCTDTDSPRQSAETSSTTAHHATRAASRSPISPTDTSASRSRARSGSTDELGFAGFTLWIMADAFNRGRAAGVGSDCCDDRLGQFRSRRNIDPNENMDYRNPKRFRDLGTCMQCNLPECLTIQMKTDSDFQLARESNR